MNLFLPPLLVLCLHCALILSDPVDTDEVKSTNKVSCNRSERNLKTLITVKEIEDVFKSCEAAVKTRLDLEAYLYKKGRVVKAGDRRADTSLNRMRNSDPIVRQYELNHLVFEEATKKLHLRFNLTKAEIARYLQTIPLTGKLGRLLKAICTRNTTPNVRCDWNAKYRTADGSCNNPINSNWGRAMTCQRRCMGAYYEGSSDYRKSVTGEELPEPRDVSNNVHKHLSVFNFFWSLMFPIFGQLADHDTALTPGSTTVDNQPIQCCPPQEETHPQCKPILVRRNDHFYSQYGVTCMNFVRSAMCPTCNLGHKEMLNQPTAFLDMSFCYGNSLNETNSLRTNDGTGRLRSQDGPDGPLLPPSRDPQNDQCSSLETNEICFEAGDSRVNQHTLLTSLQTIFLRNHNSLADGLRELNPHWDDERIFQEARRINIAMYLKIIYGEFLQILLGEDEVKRRNLGVGGPRTKYDIWVDPSLIIEYSTAAFRIGHSLINTIIADYPKNATGQSIELKDDFFQPFLLYRGYTGPLLRGASNSFGQEFDRHLVPDLRNYLYRARGDPTGLDLAAININRGRDHGVPPYVEAVKFCTDGKIVIKSFTDLGIQGYGLMEDEQVQKLQENYKDVRDVDLWTGILSEIKPSDAVAPPTANCFIWRQFYAWKFGDRHYFEHGNTPGEFTYQQLTEIRNSNFSEMLCRNSKELNMPSNPMLLVTDSNPLIECPKVKKFDLSYWRERRSTSIFSKIFG